MKLLLHDFHERMGAAFSEMSGEEIVSDYGDGPAEYAALHQTAGVLDFSFRGRICLVGNDRVRFLHGQITNDVKKLQTGEGCYAAITTAKGKMESDLNVFNLRDELLLDFEPGLTERISRRLEKFIVADDAQVVNVAPHYGLFTVQGPRSVEAVEAAGLTATLPAGERAIVKVADEAAGEIYLAKCRRLFEPGIDVFAPNQTLHRLAERLVSGVRKAGGRPCGWTAFETARIEAGIPRFGADMDDTNLPMECIESRAMSFNKGCYIGQEVLNRVHAIGQVAKTLRGLRLARDLRQLPKRGDKLMLNGREMGYITSAAWSPVLEANIAMGYVRREANEIGTDLTVDTENEPSGAKIVELPFVGTPVTKYQKAY